MLRKKSKRLDTSRRSSRVTRSPAFSPSDGALSNKKSHPHLCSLSLAVSFPQTAYVILFGALDAKQSGGAVERPFLQRVAAENLLWQPLATLQNRTLELL